ncbi:MAG: CARDB domain-containing protein [Candidatus Paceibacterota bacterium]
MQNRAAVVNGLAVVGFMALISFGVWLAVYSTRFVPAVVGRVGTAAVYLGSVFTPANEPSLSVVPTEDTTIPFGEASTTLSTSASSTVAALATPEPVAKPVAPSAGKKTTSTAALGDATPTPTTLSGLPDLMVKINRIGYMATTSDLFIASSTIPAGSRPAINFTIKNIGTNVSGAWRFSAAIPTQTSYIYESPKQQTLAPGDSIEYTLGFDQATSGAHENLVITANFDDAIKELSAKNNVASTSLTVLSS